MRRAICLLLVLLSLAPSLRAGDEKYQLTLLLSPTAEWLRFSKSINSGTYNNSFGTKLSYNFGVEYKRFFDPSLSFSVGAIYMNKGFRNQIRNQDGSRAGSTLASIHIAAVPLSLNLHHRLRRKVEMIYTAGITGGYVFSERARNNYLSGETDPVQGIWDLSEGGVEMNLFRDYYVGAHFGIGISTYVKSRIVLIVQPMYRYQLHDARDFSGQFNSNDPFVARLNSFGIDLKIGYFFTKQIRNRKKQY
jgi:hypothetical protein